VSITQIGTNFINEIAEYFSESSGVLSIGEIEHELTQKVQACVCDLLNQYLEEVDERILLDKAGRRHAGYSVERRGDERRLLTTIGELCYARTYYSCKDGTYAYLVDKAVGLESYARISDGVSVSLAKAAGQMSYAKSSDYVVSGAVSRQTVMRKVRECDVVRPPEPSEKYRVSVLHIDADEAHITLYGGRKSIVPLISVYEGIEKRGKRHTCREIFHISEYGRTPDELWEQALSEIEARYELNGAAVYLHGDGAAWVKKGLEWFPKAKFVLDKYHKNKEITAMTAGLEKALRKEYQIQIRYALAQNDSRFLLELADSLISQLPQREEVIRQAAGYLCRQIEGVAICAADPEANNGGCTEPHVSHVLSSRLSSRPMAWSKKTLVKLAPMLASGGNVELCRECQEPRELLLLKAIRAASNAFKSIKFAPDPRSVGALQPISIGKRSSLHKALRAISSYRPL
jgi:hypothetical protein